MKVYITKHALTQGIYEVDVEQPNKDYPDSVFAKKDGSFGVYRDSFHGQGKEWHRSLASAECKAEQMRVAKIVSLKKQIKKLEEMAF
jgi:hypothetical protein